MMLCVLSVYSVALVDHEVVLWSSRVAVQDLMLLWSRYEAARLASYLICGVIIILPISSMDLQGEFDTHERLLGMERADTTVP